MQNTNLGCAAHTCIHNTQGICYAGGINVDGKQARTTSATYCASYEDKNASGFTSSTNPSNTVGTDNIICQAEKCKYNENKLCKADSVKINANDASCETFVLR